MTPTSEAPLLSPRSREICIETLKRFWLPALVAFLCAGVAWFAGYEYFYMLRREAVSLRDEIDYSGEIVCRRFSKDPCWTWFLANLLISSFGLFAWRRFGGWLSAPIVVLLCVLSGYLIAATNDRYSFEPFNNPSFGIKGGLLSGLLLVPGVAFTQFRAARVPCTLRTLFAATTFIACLLGVLKAYDWHELQIYRENVAEMERERIERESHWVPTSGSAGSPSRSR